MGQSRLLRYSTRRCRGELEPVNLARWCLARPATPTTSRLLRDAVDNKTLLNPESEMPRTMPGHQVRCWHTKPLIRTWRVIRIKQ